MHALLELGGFRPIVCGINTLKVGAKSQCEKGCGSGVFRLGCRRFCASGTGEDDTASCRAALRETALASDVLAAYLHGVTFEASIGALSLFAVRTNRSSEAPFYSTARSNKFHVLTLPSLFHFSYAL